MSARQLIHLKNLRRFFGFLPCYIFGLFRSLEDTISCLSRGTKFGPCRPSFKKPAVKNWEITLIKYFRVNDNFPDSLLALFCLTDVLFGELLVVYKVYHKCRSKD